MSAIVLVTAVMLSATMPPVPPVLRGVDSLPGAEAVAAVPVDVLVAVVADRGQRPLWRARAARLLAARDVDDAAIDAVLDAVIADTAASSALRAQATLALAERAARRRQLAAVAALADRALGDDDPAVARAGSFVWWWYGGEDAHRRLTALSARPDAIGGAARGRLRSFGTSGGWRHLDGDGLGGGVLDPGHGGPSLLDDGSCSVQNTCLTNADAVHATCPQLFKCGTCVAWTPREKNRFTRNSGQCLLNRSSTQYLDCNAPICPYYRPRADSPAALEWRARPTTERSREVKKRTGTMTREAPPPSPEALAFAAFQHQPDAVGAVGVPVLVGQLGGDPLAPLLERFRGGIVQISASDGTRELPIEALWARLLLVRRALDRLDAATSASRLESETRQKVEKDIAGMAGSMTTFNLLFARKDDGFKGTGKGE